MARQSNLVATEKGQKNVLLEHHVINQKMRSDVLMDNILDYIVWVLSLLEKK